MYVSGCFCSRVGVNQLDLKMPWRCHPLHLGGVECIRGACLGPFGGVWVSVAWWAVSEEEGIVWVSPCSKHFLRGLHLSMLS